MSDVRCGNCDVPAAAAGNCEVRCGNCEVLCWPGCAGNAPLGIASVLRLMACVPRSLAADTAASTGAAENAAAAPPGAPAAEATAARISVRLTSGGAISLRVSKKPE